ncbi:MAG: dipeptidase [Phycisphaerae bacterium]|nr:dipeptidase [Phycisphaerae bacterium]
MSSRAATLLFERNKDAWLAGLLNFLRFPTISTLSEHADAMQRCVEWIRDRLVEAGLQAEILATGGHPAVFADTGPVVGAPTFLVYGHYDVQPVGDLNLWQSPPFEPTIRDGAIYARGSADDKGQVMIHLAALRCWKDTGTTWPVRVKLLIEGEEEIGSKHLAGLIESNREKLACDYVLISDTAKLDADTPALTCSTRGLVYKEITVRGPSHDLHSGVYGGAVANPANVLATIIASLHDEHRRVTIPGFYDDVAQLSAEERRTLASCGISDADLLAATGSRAPYGEEGFSSAERCGVRPTLDVNGMVSGFTGEGSATIIPAAASAKISMRLVAYQEPDKISAAFDEAVRRAAPPVVQLTIATRSTCGAYLCPPDSPGMQMARQALAEGFGREPVLAHEGGTLPILPLFKKVLGADSLLMGFAMPNCNLHSPNEFFHVRDFELGVRSILRFIEIAGDSVR